MPADRVDLHIVSYVRWDREGWLPFQQSRLDLVQTLDGLLDLLEHDPSHPGFLLGGQVIAAEDYLDIRPQAAERLTRAVERGQIQLGPWYVLTDPLLASPESLIRNLLIGQQSTDVFSAPPSPALLLDVSSVPGQLPQILRGFGLSNVVLDDRIGDLAPEMWWDGPDGSRLLITTLHENGPGLPLEHDELKATLRHVTEHLGAASQTGVLLMLHPAGALHEEMQLVAALNGLHRRSDGLRAVPSTLEGYVRAALERTGFYPLAVGELCLPNQLTTREGMLSSQMGIKQRNHELQSLLEHWAEPFSAWAGALVSTDQSPAVPSIPHNPAGLIHHAWQLLLKNQSLNAIRGTVADDVAGELKTRFTQVEQLAGTLADRSLQSLAARVSTPEVDAPADLLPVVVFNAGGQPTTDLVNVAPPAPIDPDTLFEAVDVDGATYPVEVEVMHHETGEVEQRLAFAAHDVPAVGYRSYTLRPAGMAPRSADLLEEEVTSIENERLHVTVNTENGTVTVLDRETGHTFSGLNHYADTGDCGDVYTYCPPARDLLIDIPANTPLRVRHSVGPVTQTLELLQIYRLPSALTPARDARQPLTRQFVPITVATRYRLTRGVPRLDVGVMIINDASDHRLRTLFPTGIQTDEAWFDGHFEVVKRAIGQAGANFHQRGFTTVLGEDYGLTIANRGLPAVSIEPGRDGAAVIAITLLRSVGWLSRDDLPNRAGSPGPDLAAPAAQQHDSFSLAYSIIPHGPDPLAAWQAARAFQTPFRAVTPEPHQSEPALPPSGSLVTVDNPAFVLSAVKCSEDGSGMIVRGYNISGAAEPVSVRFGLPFEAVEFVRLDETPIGESPQLDGERVQFDARPGEVVTLLFSTP